MLFDLLLFSAYPKRCGRNVAIWGKAITRPTQINTGMMNQVTALNMAPAEASGTIPLTTYTINPTGGVMPLTITTSMSITPNHTKLKPAAVHRGRKSGIVIIISMAASKT